MKNRAYSIWDEIKDGLTIVGFILLMVVVIVIATVAVVVASAMIPGILFSVCWNISVAPLLGFSTISVIPALVLSFTISYLKTSFLGNIKYNYHSVLSEFEEHGEKKSKIFSGIATAVITILNIVIASWLFMYSWNNILPGLLNIEMVKITFIQSVCFSYILNLILGTTIPSESSKKDKKKDKSSKIKVEPQKQDKEENLDDVKFIEIEEYAESDDESIEDTADSEDETDNSEE